MNKFLKTFSLVILGLIVMNPVFSQKSVGINTLNPNPNAVLELVAPDGNQGLLLPKLTTVQRTDVSFMSSLSSSENGLIVYDTTLNSLFWWDGTSWKTYESGEVYSEGTGIEIAMVLLPIYYLTKSLLLKQPEVLMLQVLILTSLLMLRMAIRMQQMRFKNFHFLAMFFLSQALLQLNFLLQLLLTGRF